MTEWNWGWEVDGLEDIDNYEGHDDDDDYEDFIPPPKKKAPLRSMRKYSDGESPGTMKRKPKNWYKK